MLTECVHLSLRGQTIKTETVRSHIDGLVGSNALMEVKCPLSADGTDSPEDAINKGKVYINKC